MIEWEGPVKGMIVNLAKSNVWRFSGSLEIDDLIQEGYLAYAFCLERYKVENIRHFISLLKRVFISRIHKMAKKYSNAPCASEPLNDGKERDTVGDLENDGITRLLLRELPDELVEVMKFLLSDMDGFIHRGKKRETTGAMLRRNGFNRWLVSDLKEYFTSGV